ncbi:MAG: TonB-dependent receptor, partial [Thermoanaerobaculia bacterium]
MSFIARERTGVKVALMLAVAALLLVPQAQAQVPRGTLVGNVQDAQGASLPGVTITATSDRLQGARTTTTAINGSYKLVSLPAGVYKITYELDGFATAVTEFKVSAAQIGTANIEMQLSEISEEIVVTSLSEQISETGTAATTFTREEINALPVTGSILSIVNLAPGVHDTGPSAAPSINGAMSFENLFMINGVPNMDNVRGTPLPLFIEDAVQETTVATSGVSAEYGRFTGGVVNVLTKSGGNQFSGSLRINYENNDWEAKTPLSNDRIDDISHEESATLGGYFWKDHLWFFGALRQRAESTTGQTNTTLISFDTTDNEDRTEGKLTISATPSHSLVGSFIEIERERANTAF